MLQMKHNYLSKHHAKSCSFHAK